jgi:hypothetical protein
MGRRRALVLITLVVVWGLVGVRIVAELQRSASALRHHDFRTLAADQRLFYAGIYPHAAVEPPPPGEREAYSVYPPYAFPLAMPWIPPLLPAPFAEAWFSVLQAMAVAGLVFFGWRTGNEIDRMLGWILAGVIAGMTGLWADVLFGNFSAITCALLIVTYELQRRNRPVSAGLAWVLAMLKPQVGTMFFVPFLNRPAWRGLAWGCSILGVLLLIACAWTGVNPWRAISGPYLKGLLELSQSGRSLVTVAAYFGMPAAFVQPVLLVVGAIGLFVMFRARSSQPDLLAEFAAVALVGRLCLYHRTCDDLMLVFALVYFGRQAWRSDQARDGLAAMALAVSVCIPTRWSDSIGAAIFTTGIWLSALLKVIGDSRPDVTPAQHKLTNR